MHLKRIWAPFSILPRKRENNLKKNNPDAKVYVVVINKKAKEEWDVLTETHKEKYNEKKESNK